MRIPDEVLREIKLRNDIEDVLSRYVSLKSSGSNLSACCPFHSEKTPSFTVFRATKSYYCFGCGAGGDVITFMMQIENLDYISAVTKLADFAKIPLPENNGEYREKLVQQKRIYDINRETAIYFHRNLYEDSGKTALEYLYLRKLKNATIKHFGIGYAGKKWDSLTNYLSDNGFSKDEQKRAFLCGMTKKGDYIDYFRDRIIFPIIDLQSNVIGFGGRAIGKNADGSDVMPKYLNTADTPAFKKSRNLYALNFAKNSKRDYFILCEGYMDVVSMHQAGLTNAVASLGTAFTGEHARMIEKYTKSVILAYDSDNAGKRAMERASALLSEVGIRVKVLEISGAKDPDEFIQRFGKEKFENAVKDSKGYIYSKVNHVYKKYGVTEGKSGNIGDEGAEKRVRAVNEICEILAGVNSQLEQEVYSNEAAKIYGVSAESMMREIQRLAAKRRRREKDEVINRDLRKSEGVHDKINSDTVKNPKAAKLEENIIGTLMLYPELYRDAKADIDIDMNEDIFVTEFNKKVFRVFEDSIKEHGAENFDPAFVSREFSAEESGRITRMMVNGMKHTDNDKHRLAKLIGALRKENAKQNLKMNDIITDGDKWANYIRRKSAGSGDINDI